MLVQIPVCIIFVRYTGRVWWIFEYLYNFRFKYLFLFVLFLDRNLDINYCQAKVVGPSPAVHAFWKSWKMWKVPKLVFAIGKRMPTIWYTNWWRMPWYISRTVWISLWTHLMWQTVKKSQIQQQIVHFSTDLNRM